MHHDEYKGKDHHDRFIEPLVESEHYPYSEDHEFGYETPKLHSREVEYEIDPAGHVHMFEERPDFNTTFTQ